MQLIKKGGYEQRRVKGYFITNNIPDASRTIIWETYKTTTYGIELLCSSQRKQKYNITYN